MSERPDVSVMAVDLFLRPLDPVRRGCLRVRHALHGDFEDLTEALKQSLASFPPTPARLFSTSARKSDEAVFKLDAASRHIEFHIGS